MAGAAGASTVRAQPPEAPSEAERGGDQAELDTRERQLTLYRQAFVAFEQERYEEAADRLRAAVALGDLDILRLSLARALSHQGQCEAAVRQLDLALRAPAAGVPPPDQVRQRVERYRSEIQRDCRPAERTLDGAGAPEPREPPRERPASGPETVTSAPPEGRPAEADGAGPAVTAARAPDSAEGDRPVVGWVVLGAGAAVLVASVATDVLVVGERVDVYREAVRTGDPNAAEAKRDAETWQNVVLGSYIAGGALLAVGGVIVILGVLGDGGEEPAGMSWWWSPSGGGIGWRGRW